MIKQNSFKFLPIKRTHINLPLFILLVEQNLRNTLELISGQLLLFQNGKYNPIISKSCKYHQWTLDDPHQPLNHGISEIHPSEVSYAFRWRTHILVHGINGLNINLGHHRLRQHLQSSSKFDMSHLLGQRIIRNFRNLWLHIFACIPTHARYSRCYILKSIKTRLRRRIFIKIYCMEQISSNERSIVS